MYKYKLKRNGVRIFYAKESIPEGPEGIILESVMEGYAEYYSENLSQNVKRGYYDSALELKTLGQTVLGLRKGPDGRFDRAKSWHSLSCPSILSSRWPLLEYRA